MASSLDDFTPGVVTQDTRKRIATHPELLSYLRDPSSSLQCEELDKFIDGLSSWVGSSNFKVGRMLSKIQYSFGCMMDTFENS